MQEAVVGQTLWGFGRVLSWSRLVWVRRLRDRGRRHGWRGRPGRPGSIAISTSIRTLAEGGNSRGRFFLRSRWKSLIKRTKTKKKDSCSQLEEPLTGSQRKAYLCPKTRGWGYTFNMVRGSKQIAIVCLGVHVNTSIDRRVKRSVPDF